MLCCIYHINQSPLILEIIEPFSKKMKMASAKLQLYLTNTLDFSSAQKKKNELLLNRKQKKLVELK